MHGIVQSSGYCDYSLLPKFQPKDLKVKQIAKGSERGKVLHSLMEKWRKTWMIMFAPNFKILFNLKQMRKRVFALDTHSNRRLHFTVQSSRQNCLIAAQLRNWSWNCSIVKSFVSVYLTETFLIQFFSRIRYWVWESLGSVAVKRFFSRQNCPWRQQSRKENRCLDWDKPVQYLRFSSCANFLSFCWSTLVAFGEFIFPKILTNHFLGWRFVYCSRINFTIIKSMKDLISTNNRNFISLASPSETVKLQAFYERLQFDLFN